MFLTFQRQNSAITVDISWMQQKKLLCNFSIADKLTLFDILWRTRSILCWEVFHTNIMFFKFCPNLQEVYLRGLLLFKWQGLQPITSQKLSTFTGVSWKSCLKVRLSLISILILAQHFFWRARQVAAIGVATVVGVLLVY